MGSTFGGGSLSDQETGQRPHINDDGQLHVVMQGKADAGNSTVTPLLADATFTGTGIDISEFAAITLLVESDEASATDGMKAQFSNDNTEWHDGEEYTIAAGDNKFFTPPVQAQYFRMVYVNGGTDQTYFHMHAMLKKVPVKWSSHNIDSPITGSDDSELVKAVITGQRTDGIFDNVHLTNGANMKVSLEELETGLSSNTKTQLNVTPFHADGTEGCLITGIDYATGKSGIDRSTETLQGIDYEHHEIHAGSHYFTTSYQDLAINQVLDFTWMMPNTTEEIHWTFNLSVENETLWQIYETVVETNPLANLITPYNSDRNSGNSSSTVMRYEVQANLTAADADTNVSGGDLIKSGIAGSGRDAGIVLRSNELIMKHNTLYCLRATASTAGFVSFDMQWYEHTPKS